MTKNIKLEKGKKYDVFAEETLEVGSPFLIIDIHKGSAFVEDALGNIDCYDVGKWTWKKYLFDKIEVGDIVKVEMDANYYLVGILLDKEAVTLHFSSSDKDDKCILNKRHIKSITKLVPEVKND